MIWPLPLVWVACAVAGYLWSQQQNIPWTTASAALPAFLLEATFFYVLAVERLRTRLEKAPPAMFAAGLTMAAIAPYCAASIAFGSFRWESLLWIAALSAAVSFWYVLLPHKPASDLLLLLFMAALMVDGFNRFYVRPHPKLPLEVLGKAMWIRTGVFAMLSVRRVKGVGFGFWPSAREWNIGTVYFALFLPFAALVAWWIGFAKPHLPALGWQKTSLVALGTFFGVLWVLALGEEFFFRGLLQQWMTAWLKSEWGGLIVASILFGSAHLWFGHKFPNWRFAMLAALAGLFYGLAFRRARSIRASMVVHALTVTTWKMFFS